MAREIKIPVPDQTTEEVRIVKWHKALGDAVAKGEVVLEVETDQSSDELTFAIQGRGKKETSWFAKTLAITNDVNHYRVPVSCLAESVAIRMTYTGTNPPTVHLLGINADEVPVR